MENQPDNNTKNWPRGLLLVAIILVVIVGVPYLFSQISSGTETITMSKLAQYIDNGAVRKITMSGDSLEVELKTNEVVQTRKEEDTGLYETLAILGVSQEKLQAVDIDVTGPGMYAIFGNVLLGILPLAILGWFVFMMLRSVRGNQDQALSFGRSRAKVTKVDQPMVTFEDVAGMDESKQEVAEIVQFLKEPEKFINLGARVPKGVLMIGPPGTGKTLLARAIAGEAGVPFMSISGSEFVEMFVGVGASRVRDLFDRAKEVAPCIIFVDEIDAVGRMRGTGLGGGHDEREQTLNQILVEMDGFDNDTNIIVIAATNRADVLDPALMRPGRFDRKVYISRPDVRGREEILGVHSRGKPLNESVNLETIAKLTPGFSGADIENLVNEAAILAAQRELSSIGMPELQDAMEKIVAGPERRTRVVTPEEKQVVAYHEAGHAVVMYNLQHSDPVHKITIIPRGQAGGYTMSLPESMDSGLMSREQLLDMITGLLGGRAAEELTFKRITTGASNDLERVTSIAKAMVTRYGMSERAGLRVYAENNDTVFLGRSIAEQRNYSEDAARNIDDEIRRIIDEGYAQAVNILTTYQDRLEALAQTLLEIETVNRQQFEAVMEQGYLPELVTP